MHITFKLYLLELNIHFYKVMMNAKILLFLEGCLLYSLFCLTLLSFGYLLLGTSSRFVLFLSAFLTFYMCLSF